VIECLLAQRSEEIETEKEQKLAKLDAIIA
jgi:hypothetical protein